MRELFKRSLRKSRENWSQYRCEVAILLQVRKWDEYAVKKDRGSGAMISWRIYGRSRVGTGSLFLQIRFVQERRLFWWNREIRFHLEEGQCKFTCKLYVKNNLFLFISFIFIQSDGWIGWKNKKSFLKVFWNDIRNEFWKDF